MADTLRVFSPHPNVFAFYDGRIAGARHFEAHNWVDDAALDVGIATYAVVSGPPAISPLFMPTQSFSDGMELLIGSIKVQLLHFNIHSDDGTVAFLPDERILLAGDTMEDPVTYVAEPQNIARHLVDLKRMAALNPSKILPSHGCSNRIASGGYGPAFIDAAMHYNEFLLRLKLEPTLASTSLQEVIKPWLDNGTLIWFDGYVEVHASNIALATS